MWHSNVSPTREYDRTISFTGFGKSEYSCGCEWLNSGRLEGIQFSSTGVEATSVSVCLFCWHGSVKGITALDEMVDDSLSRGCDWNLSAASMNDCVWFSELWYVNGPAMVLLSESVPLVKTDSLTEALLDLL